MTFFKTPIYNCKLVALSLSKGVIRNFFILFILFSCTKKKEVPDVYGFPDEVGEIMIKKCATVGCHTDASYTGAGGLNLSSWEKLFQGSNNGSAVIPFSTDYSSLLSFVNTYPDLGTTLQPTMPVNKAPLSREEVQVLKNWIKSGAPDREGNVKFADNADRKKVYVANRGCDVVTIFDAESGLPMRYVSVGVDETSELPIMIKVAPDKKYWYVLFSNSEYLQKFRASDDKLIGQVQLGLYDWFSMDISPNSKTAVCVDQSPQGRIALIDLETMSVSQMYGGNTTYASPRGAVFYNDSVFYSTSSAGNFVYKVNFGAPYTVNKPNVKKISFDVGVAPISTLQFAPHEIKFSPSGENYLISCFASDEVRVMNTQQDSLVAVIPVGKSPTDMAMTNGSSYAFVTCMDDKSSFPGNAPGSIAVIDLSTLQKIKTIYPGCEPRSAAIYNNKLYVANRNVSSEGPAPHHTSGTCGGRNGYTTMININTLELIPSGKTEVSVNPYSVSVR